MKTHDVEQLYGVTKRTLAYYEEKELIKPLRDDNGYRNYNQEDLRILNMIITLRNYNLSINEIKLVLDEELSLQECLESKQETIKKEIKQQQDIINKIQKNLVRRKAEFTCIKNTSDLKEVSVCFEENKIIISDIYNNFFKEDISINYDDVIELGLSICTRVYSRHLSDGQTSMVGVVDAYKTNNGNIPGLITVFFVDFDIKTSGYTYKYESTSIKNMKKIMGIIKDKNIVSNDPLKLVEFFSDYGDDPKLETILLQKIKLWSKIIDIDNPRSIEIKNQAKYVKENLESFVQPAASKIKVTKNGIHIPARVSLSRPFRILWVMLLIGLCIWGLVENYF